jgi:glycosyltransferase involved in cell wall biosynthesis
MTRVLLFVINDLDFFISHRLPIALAAKAEGYDVHVAAPAGNDAPLRAHGLVIHPIRLGRRSLNAFGEARVVADLIGLMRRIKPDVVHLVTPKPIAVGGLAARLARVPAVVAAVSGLGYVFIGTSAKIRLLRGAVGRVYKIVMAHPNARVIFQNPDDRKLLTSLGIVDAEKTVLIPGSGVSLSEYAVHPEPAGPPHVVFAARLLKDKGILEFIDAIRILKANGIAARFSVIGDPDPGNPTTVTDSEIEAWKREGIAEFLGHRKDIAAQFKDANIVVLPSYREGLPKVLIEAASCGRAVITTDVPGCRDAIEAGRTGLLVPVRDGIALAAAIETLVADAALRAGMGAAGRALAERTFAVEKVIATHLSIYAGLIETAVARKAARARS